MRPMNGGQTVLTIQRTAETGPSLQHTSITVLVQLHCYCFAVSSPPTQRDAVLGFSEEILNINNILFVIYIYFFFPYLLY